MRQIDLAAHDREPWLNACLGYWGHQLNASDPAAVWSGDPKVRSFRDSGDREYWTSYKGPISAASGAPAAERQAKRYYKS